MDYADSYWFDDGHRAHLRNCLWEVSSIPEFVPAGENPVLRLSSVVRNIECSEHKIMRAAAFAGLEKKQA